jgi:hypothetical protein
MRKAAALLLLAFPFLALAAPTPRAQGEIEHLIGYIAGASDCRFNRNGSWHDMAEARGHVTMKYEYLRDLDRVATAEDFIDGAASRSSLSGKDYLVQCGAAPAMPAGAWLRAELARWRAAHG